MRSRMSAREFKGWLETLVYEHELREQAELVAAAKARAGVR